MTLFGSRIIEVVIGYNEVLLKNPGVQIPELQKRKQNKKATIKKTPQQNTNHMLSLMKCASSAPMKSSNMEASATLRREIRFCFSKSVGI
jgi:hypothetical protein